MKPLTIKHTALALALALASAQGAWAGTTTVALTGSAAPGTGSGVSFASLNVPQLNSTGQVAFRATLSGAGVTGSNDGGIWRDGSLIVREGSAATGAGSGVSFSAFSSIQLNAAGQVAYSAALSGSNITLGKNDRSLWLGNQLIAQTGNAAPGADSGVTFASFSPGKLNAAGQVAYQAQLTGPGISLGTDSGIWRDSNLVALEGRPAPGAGSGVSFSFLELEDFNAAGQVAYRANLTGTIVSSVNDVSIWRNNALIAREGSSAPGSVAGLNFGNLTSPQLNAFGQLAFQSALTGTGVVTNANDIAIWRGDTLIARRGEAAPGTASGVSFISLLAPKINDVGQVAFGGVLTGAGISPDNRVGIWRDTTLIVRSGQTAPGTSGGVRIADIGSNPELSAGGQVSFAADLAGTGVSSANDRALYVADGVESILAARTGDALAGSTIISLATSSASFNDKAQLAYQATLADGRFGVFLFTPTLHWRSGTGGNWDDAARWTLGVNPSDVHDVIVDAASSLGITGPSGAVKLKSLQVGTGAGLVTLQMAGGSFDAADPVVIGPRGVLTGTGSFSRLVINQGTVQADRLVMSESLSNAGLVRGVAGGPRQGAGLEANLLNQAGGRVLVQPGETLQLRGASHRNLGVFEINQGRLEVTGSLLNGSGGLIDLNGATAVASGAWNNAAGARILLGNARLTVSGGLSNSGQLLVTSGDSDVFGDLSNETGGQIILSGQGSTTFYDAVELQANSELRTSAGATAVFFGAVAQRSGALLSGTGHKYFEGGFSVGNSPGLGEDGGDVSFGAANVYLAELGGTELGSSYDHYRVAGTLTLGGTLRLASFAGFSGQAGQSFDLFDWGTLQGQFSNIDSSGLLLAEGTQLDLSRLYIDGVIGVTAVPEPAQWALMLLGGLGLLAWRRKGAPRSVCSLSRRDL
ncbi:PEP-CTERM sorting domain-containing protein [Paucibacter sp. DJ1R-11]|uniref:beta strand repeat-containing protein n=1 Tax=Paucibacter sp. DJ1R-11 TaxID=2893556 RepID=UPI0021E3B7E9|nr:choice-of-anchor tandem repeat NxxGxxAF-containing protein [Paucibacter sp. DJ1R-11]MCV2362334.1 PEP-CTERM sorting domain-containing protein [Paucibacter sp. DJ1R-11]